MEATHFNQMVRLWLESEGLKYDQPDFGIAFRYQGGSFVVPDNPNDPQYFNVAMPMVFEASDHPEIPTEKILEVCNHITQRYKVVKASADKDYDCALTCEQFLPREADPGEIMERMLNVMLQARVEFHFLLTRKED